MSGQKEKVVLAVAAIIKDEQDRVLLALRAEDPKEGYWHHPGGCIEYGETLHQALKRELREELGVETEITSALPVDVTQSIIPDEDRHVICLYFTAVIVSGTPTPRDGTAAVAYLGQEKAGRLPLLDTCRAVQRRVFRWNI